MTYSFGSHFFFPLLYYLTLNPDHIYGDYLKIPFILIPSYLTFLVWVFISVFFLLCLSHMYSIFVLNLFVNKLDPFNFYLLILESKPRGLRHIRQVFYQRATPQCLLSYFETRFHQISQAVLKLVVFLPQSPKKLRLQVCTITPHSSVIFYSL